MTGRRWGITLDTSARFRHCTDFTEDERARLEELVRRCDERDEQRLVFARYLMLTGTLLAEEWCIPPLALLRVGTPP